MSQKIFMLKGDTENGMITCSTFTRRISKILSLAPYSDVGNRHGRGARPPPGIDPYKMTWKIKFNFLLSLPRRQRRGNVNKILKAELARKKQLRKAAKNAATVTPANPYYQHQIQVTLPNLFPSQHSLAHDAQKLLTTASINFVSKR